jgi:hypothetical protein
VVVLGFVEPFMIENDDNYTDAEREREVRNGMSNTTTHTNTLHRILLPCV